MCIWAELQYVSHWVQLFVKPRRVLCVYLDGMISGEYSVFIDDKEH